VRTAHNTSNYLQAGIVHLAVIILIVLISAGGVVTASSQKSLPGSILYPVKQATENIRTTTTFGDSAKANVYLDIADEKLNEVEKLEEKGKTDQIPVALNLLQQNQQKATEKIEKAQSEGKDVEAIVSKLQANLERQQLVLIRVLDQVPEQAKEAIEQAAENSQQGLMNAQEMQNKNKENSVDTGDDFDEPKDGDDDGDDDGGGNGFNPTPTTGSSNGGSKPTTIPPTSAPAPTSIPATPTSAPTPTISTGSCSTNYDNVCPITCAAGADADCCIQKSADWIWVTGRGCYLKSSNISPNIDCSGESSDGYCPAWCGVSADKDCCLQVGKQWVAGSGCY